MKPSGNEKSGVEFEFFSIELKPIGNDTTNFNYKYTGQERDTFTNFDYMHFRFYASSTGRFLKPDNIIPDITNPQNWNGYSYVKGNPINFNDSSGHETPDAVQQSVKTETSANVSNPPRSTDNNNEQMKKKLTAQPKKVGDDSFKFVFHICDVTVNAIEKSATPSKAEVKAAEEWGLTFLLKMPELKIAKDIGGAVSTFFDARTVYKNVFTAKAMGSGMSNEELKETWLDIGIAVTVGAISTFLLPETGFVSLIPLVASVGAVATDLGKLANAYLDPSAPLKKRENTTQPKSWATSGNWY